MKETSDRRKRLFTVLFPALLGPSQLLLFGPHTIYSANQSEFNAPFWSMAALLLPILALLLGALVAVGLILSDRLFRGYVAILFGLGVLLWVQGNLLVAEYGLLDGQGLDLSRHAWRTPYEAALWIGVLGLAAAFAGRVSTVAPIASQFLVALQILVLVVPTVSAAEESQAVGPEWHLPPERIYEFSRDRNVIHIVLDAFQSEIFGEIVENDRTTFDRAFSGFVFFADHAGAFPTTRASIPAMFTSIAYRNETPINEFTYTQFRERLMLNVLADHGYEIDSVSSVSRVRSRNAVHYTIPMPYWSYREYVRFVAAQLIDLSLFRHVPHKFKSGIYNEQAWLVQGSYAELLPSDRATRRYPPSNDVAFLKEFARRMTVARDGPVYKFIHVSLPHSPTVVDADCSFHGVTDRSWESVTAQSRCALAVVQELLDGLRTLGIYDSSVILLTSDHGAHVPRDGSFEGMTSPAGDLSLVAASAMALLAVKPTGSTGPLQTSYAPTAITDIPATVLELVNLPYNLFQGEPAFRLDPDSSRRRTFAHHPWRHADWQREYFEVLHVFSIDGGLTEPSAWTFRETIFEPSGDLEAQLEQHRAGLYELEGGADGPFRWGDTQVVIYVPPTARVFTIPVRKTPRATYPQTVTVRIDGKVVDQRVLADSSWKTLRQELQPRGEGGSPFCIELLVDPPWHDEGGRQLGVMYRDHDWTR